MAALPNATNRLPFGLKKAPSPRRTGRLHSRRAAAEPTPEEAPAGGFPKTYEGPAEIRAFIAWDNG
jgi:hypothetical protein